MQKINPLYIAMLLIILAIFISIKRYEFKDELYNETTSYNKTKKELKEIVFLKSRWKNSKKRLENIIKNGNYKDIKFSTVESGEKLILSASGVSPKDLRAFTNKLFNSYVKLNSISIKKTDKKASIRVEIIK